MLKPTTPLKCSLAFMQWGRSRFMDWYHLVIILLTGNLLYPELPESFASINLLITSMYLAVSVKNWVLAESILDEIKIKMRTNATYVQENCLNNLDRKSVV